MLLLSLMTNILVLTKVHNTKETIRKKSNEAISKIKEKAKLTRKKN